MRIYLDHNATCPLRPEAREALVAALARIGGNPSSAHAEGRAARRLLEEARESIARLLGAAPEELVFTSGGTESNALALASAGREGLVLCSPIEHPSVLEPLGERDPSRRRLLRVDDEGRIDPGSIDDAGPLRPSLASFALANHETGVVQDAPALVARARAAGAAVHLDAGQALGRMPVDFRQLDADFLAASAHKFGGPVGIGLLLVRRGSPFVPLALGGEQEAGRRAGTEAVALAVAAAAALTAATRTLAADRALWTQWIVRLREAIFRLAPDALVNTPARDALPNTLNVSFPGRRGSSLVHRLDLEGVAASHGSACASGSLQPSPVLLALGAGEDRARGAVRFSVGPANGTTDFDAFEERLARALSLQAPQATPVP